MSILDNAIIKAMLPNAWKASPASMAEYLTREEPPDLRYSWPKHIEFLSRQFVECAMGRCRLVYIHCPPQHGKSRLDAVWGPIWFLEHFPSRHIIVASASADKAQDESRRTRDYIQRFQDKLTVRISPTSASVERWETTMSGSYTAAGVGSQIAGKPAHIIVVDDPHRSAEDANSQASRDVVWRWFQMDAIPRLRPDGTIVVIHTRWHPDDLAGRLIKQNETENLNLKVINLPAFAEPNDPLGRKEGEALWPEAYNIERLTWTKRWLGNYAWNALYQGRPTAPEGNRFKRQWLVPFIDAHDVGYVVKETRFWDLASTMEGEKGNRDPDWTVGVKMGLTREKTFVVLDVIRQRLTPNAVQRLVANTARKDGKHVAVRMQRDPGQAGKDQIANYARNILLGYDFRGIDRRTDKITASNAFNAACERGDVKVVSAHWTEEFVTELSMFPSGSHDDQVDAVVGAHSDLSSQSQGWNPDTIRSAFSYERKAAKETRNPVMEYLAASRAN